MENNTVSVEEKPVVSPEKILVTPAVVPKQQGSLSKIIIPLLVLLVVALGIAVYVLYNRVPVVSEPVTPVTDEITVTPSMDLSLPMRPRSRYLSAKMICMDTQMGWR